MDSWRLPKKLSNQHRLLNNVTLEHKLQQCCCCAGASRCQQTRSNNTKQRMKSCKGVDSSVVILPTCQASVQMPELPAAGWPLLPQCLCNNAQSLTAQGRQSRCSPLTGLDNCRFRFLHAKVYFEIDRKADKRRCRVISESITCYSTNLRHILIDCACEGNSQGALWPC